MKKIIVTMLCCTVNVFAFAGETNFVARFQTVWQTHNATNILLFTEQNLATNRSPETLFARGITAHMLQLWDIGATNYWEQAAQMISTNTVYTEKERTGATKVIQGLNFFLTAKNPNESPPTWNAVDHTFFFTISSDEPFYFDILEFLSTLETIEE